MTAGRRDQLASALEGRHYDDDRGYMHRIDGAAALYLGDVLLPTIDRMIRQAQAEALESAAEDWSDIRIGPDADDTHLWLRDRAAALRLTTDHPDVTQDAPRTPSEPP